MKSMKGLALSLAVCLLVTLAAAPAQAITIRELPAVQLKPVVRETALRDLFSEDGFACPAGFSFCMALDDAVEALPLSDTMRPGDEAFDSRTYVESTENGFCSLNPFLYYAIEEIDDILQLTLEFDAGHELFGYWLVSVPVKLEDMSGEERETAAARLRLLIGTLSEAAEPLVEKGPDDLGALDFAYLEAGGRLRVFFQIGEDTFCQVSASVFQGTFICNVGIGRTAEWPGGIADIIDGLKQK